jgi:hypothetical protein
VPGSEFFVLIHAGDTTGVVEELLRVHGLTPEAAGIHRLMYVTRANQTLLMARDDAAPIVPLLLDRGWEAPGRDG